MTPTDPARRPLSAGRAVVLYVAYTLAFAIGGGLAAGIMALVFEQVSGAATAAQVYAISFGVCGWIAYRLAHRVTEGR